MLLVGAGWGKAGEIGVPQFRQKRASGINGALQLEQFMLLTFQPLRTVPSYLLYYNRVLCIRQCSNSQIMLHARK